MSREIWRWIRTHLARARRRIATVVVLDAASSVAQSVVLVGLVRLVVDLAEDGDPRLRLGGVGLDGTAAIVTLVILAVCSLLANTIVGWLSARIQGDLLHAARTSATETLMATSFEGRSRQPLGSAAEILVVLAQQAASVCGAFLSALTAVVGLIVFLTLAFLIDALVTLAALTAGVLLALALRPLLGRTRLASTRLVEQTTDYTTAVGSVDQLVAEAQVGDVGGAIAQGLEPVSRLVARGATSSRFARLLGSTLYRDAALLLMTITVGVLLAVGPDLLASAGAALVMVARSLLSAQSLQISLHQVNELGPSLTALEERVAILARTPAPDGPATLGPVERISVRGLRYRFP